VDNIAEESHPEVKKSKSLAKSKFKLEEKEEKSKEKSIMERSKMKSSKGTKTVHKTGTKKQKV
jgi:hypothetical protein